MKIKNLIVRRNFEMFTHTFGTESFKITRYENTCKISFTVVWNDETEKDFCTDEYGKGLWVYVPGYNAKWTQIKGTCDVNFCCKTRSGIYKKIRRYCIEHEDFLKEDRC